MSLLDSLVASPLFGLTLTVAGYYLGLRLYRTTGLAVLPPVVLGIVSVIAVLMICRISYSQYYASARFLHELLGIVTVALAIPLYQHARRIRRLFLPILCTVLVGGTLSVSSMLLVLWLFDAGAITLLSSATKSITTPIALIVSEQIGGIPALSAMIVLITGVIGAMIGIPLMNRLGIEDAGVKGLTLGITAHALGTAKALEEGEECGAFAALAMGLTGVLTALVLPVLIGYFSRAA